MRARKSEGHTMQTSSEHPSREDILNMALECGASVAGVASVDRLRQSPAHKLESQLETYSGVGTVEPGEATHDEPQWPQSLRSAIVFGLAHLKEAPWLDWWDGRKGTPGNRELIQIASRLAKQLDEKGVQTEKLHYYPAKGGTFLKDAAVLAGLGCLGRNNLLITPEFGPRIRLRVLLTDLELEPTGPIAFDPCAACDINCRNVCPQKAMDESLYSPEKFGLDELPARDGSYDRHRCNEQMETDMAAKDYAPELEAQAVKYCRRCEWVCPVGQK